MIKQQRWEYVVAFNKETMNKYVENFKSNRDNC